MADIKNLEHLLNAPKKETRLTALKELISLQKTGEIAPFPKTDFVNNHIHTSYSFSPYSPTAALYFALKAGLCTAGIMDHDSVGGCEEFVEAGEIANMAITCGFECRVKMDGTSVYGRRINNPDQISVAYVALHGIPHQNIGLCEEFLAPYRAKRNLRNRKMNDKINDLMAKHNIFVDFDKDIIPLSLSNEGGSITERHILFALSKKLCETFGKGEGITNFLKDKLNINLPSKIEGFLKDSANPFYEYDLLGALKSDLVAAFYLDADEECPTVNDFIAFAKKVGGISAYAYLGDVGSSVTGDKKTQTFEDAYLDELFALLKDLGFNAITYMPSRNTLEQLKRVMSLCDTLSFFQISGEDINTPRQSFICEALAKDEFKHLSNSTYALIGHEIGATKDQNNAMFSDATAKKYPNLKVRVEIYEKIAKN